jgi:hypothetical protein
VRRICIIPYGQKKYSPAERKLYTARSGLLDPALNWITGRKAMLKKEVIVEYKEQMLIKLDYLFLPEYYTQTLKFLKNVRDFNIVLKTPIYEIKHCLNFDHYISQKIQ